MRLNCLIRKEAFCRKWALAFERKGTTADLRKARSLRYEANCLMREIKELSCSKQGQLLE